MIDDYPVDEPPLDIQELLDTNAALEKRIEDSTERNIELLKHVAELERDGKEVKDEDG